MIYWHFIIYINKNKGELQMKKGVIAVIVIIIMIIGIFFIKEYSQNKEKNEITNYASNDTNTSVNNTTYEDLIPDLLAIAKEHNQDVVAVIQDKETGDITEITSEEVKCYKRINEASEGEDVEEKMIETKIYVLEAKKLNLKLEEKEEKVIKRMVDSVDSMKDIKSEEEKEKFKKLVDNYMKEVMYAGELRSNLMKELENYNLPIEDDELEERVKEYKEIQENAKKNQDKVGALSGISTKYLEIENLYYSKVKEKYIVQK